MILAIELDFDSQSVKFRSFIRRVLRIGETIELKCPFMVLRLNSDEY